MTSFDATFEELFAACERGVFHLEMRETYDQDDPVYLDWKAGRSIEPAKRWSQWFSLVRATVDRGVEVRRARIVSEPVSDYIRFEYDVTQGLNLDAGEHVRWLPRQHASDLALPGNDFWLFDDHLVQFNHFSGDGQWLGVESTADPAVIGLCAAAFEAVWQRATPHDLYRLGEH